MGKKTKDVTIGETEYQITQVGGETGDMLLFKIGQALGAAAANVVSAGGGEESLALGMLQAIRYISPADFRSTVQALANSTKVGVRDVDGGGKVNFVKLSSVYDDHFAGNYASLTAWLKEALELNFADFLDDLKKRRAESKKPAA